MRMEGHTIWRLKEGYVLLPSARLHARAFATLEIAVYASTELNYVNAQKG